MNQQKTKVAFIGGGNMAQAIIHGLLDAEHPADHIYVADPDAGQRKILQAIAPDLHVHATNDEIIDSVNVVVLAVKPQIIARVAAELRHAIEPDGPIIMSIAAGTTLESLRKWFGPEAKLVRVMPNQPALVGEGMSGMCATTNVDAAGRDSASYIMAASGQLRWFDDEAQIDPLTAISGSGPAYFYLVLEILQDIGEEFGFDAETARALAVQTALGASTVAASSDESLQKLRERVTSPGGTTAAALEQLEAAGIRDIFRSALIAARDRAIELGKLDG